MNRPKDPRTFLSPAEAEQVAEAVETAERASSAELKLVIIRRCWADIRARAARAFRQHGLHKTEQHNAVLILLVSTNREFLIYGDRGIHEQVGLDFWADVRDAMQAHFERDEFGPGLAEGIARIGCKLAEYCPPRADDKNEVSNDVDFEA